MKSSSLTIGTGLRGRVLVVVYCYRDDRIRIISARPATGSEREQYEAGL
ncbi:MAG: BrnT family toxin [Bryobacteraceae bacterium]